MKQKIAVSVSNVKKDFKLPLKQGDSLKDAIVQSLSIGMPKYKTYHALKGISFDVQKGEFFGILGRNGTGKSTLLKIISEIYQPTQGKVEVTGRLVPFIELGVGFNPKLSARENVYLNGAILGFSRIEIDARYQEIVEFAELEEFMDQKLKNFSSGMRVRLAFAIAVQANADILVIDEVLAVGDADFKKKCYEYFGSLKDDDSKTVIFVTHGMSAVREYCDRAILIDQGRIIFEGSGEEAADKYRSMFNIKKKKIVDDSISTEIADIKDVSVFGETGKRSKAGYNNQIATNSNLVFEITLNIKQSTKNPILAFSARDRKGRTVFATNTKILNIKLGDLAVGEHTFSFFVDNIFTNGSFTTFSTLFDGSMNTIHARLAAASKFKVIGRDNSNRVAIAHPLVRFNGRS